MRVKTRNESPNPVSFLLTLLRSGDRNSAFQWLFVSLVLSLFAGSSASATTTLSNNAYEMVSPALPALDVSGETRDQSKDWYRAYSEPETYKSSFSGDGKLLALTSRNNPVEVWDMALRQPVATYNGGGITQSEAFVDVSENGEYIAIALEERVEVRHIETGQTQLSVPAIAGGVHAFSASGRLFATAIDGKRLDLWSIPDKKRIHSFIAHEHKITALGFDQYARYLVSGDEKGNFIVWDILETNMLYRFSEHEHEIATIRFAGQENMFVTLDVTGVARLWDARNERLLHVLGRGIEPERVRGVTAAFSADGKTVAICRNESSGISLLSLFDVDSGQPLISRELPGDPVSAIAWQSEDSALLLSKVDKSVQIVDAPTLELVETFGGQLLKASNTSVSPDGQVIATSTSDGHIQLWDAASKTLRYSLRGRNAGIENIAFSGNGEYIVTGDRSGKVTVWSRRENSRTFSVNAHKSGTAIAALGPNGDLLLTASTKSSVLKLWDIRNNKLLHKFIGHHGEITSLAFSRNGNVAASASRDGTVKLWDMVHYGLIQTYLGSGKIDGFLSVAISPDGEYMAGGVDAGMDEIHVIEVWDLKEKKHVTSLRSHNKPVTSVKFNSDASQLASGSSDGVIKVWDIGNGMVSRSFNHQKEDGEIEKNPYGKVYAVDFANHGKEIVAVTESGETLLWDLQRNRLSYTLLGGPRGTWVSDDHIRQTFVRGDDGSLIVQQDHDVPPAPLAPSGLATEDTLVLTASRKPVAVGRNGARIRLTITNKGEKPSYWIRATQLQKDAVPITLIPSHLTKLEAGQSGILDLKIFPHPSVSFMKSRKLDLKLELVTRAGSHFPIAIPLELSAVEYRIRAEGRNKKSTFQE